MSSANQTTSFNHIRKYIDEDTFQDISNYKWIQSNFSQIPRVSKVIVIDRNTYKIIRGNVESACDRYITFSNRKRCKIIYPVDSYVFLAPNNFYHTQNRKAMEYLLHRMKTDDISIS
jgi:hypothetical protein